METASHPSWFQRMRQYLIPQPDRYELVLTLLIGTYLLESVSFHSSWVEALVNILQSVTIYLTLRISLAHRRIVMLAGCFVLLNIFTALLGIISAPLQAFSHIANGCLLWIAPVTIFRRFLRKGQITGETILAALSTYLLLGSGFAFLFSLMGISGSFFVGNAHPTVNDYSFFSFTTLTTVGYGNLIPMSGLGQTVAMLEAVTGQFYLAVVVARLVSGWNRQSKSDTDMHN